jgi:lysophospholipase L1-like esterase
MEERKCEAEDALAQAARRDTVCARVLPSYARFLFLLAALACSAVAVDPRVVLLNPSMAVGYTVPAGWEGKSGIGKTRRDSQVFYSAPAALSVECTESENTFCTASQTLRAPGGIPMTVGGVLKLSGSVRAILLVQFLAADGTVLATHRAAMLFGPVNWISVENTFTLATGTEFLRINLFVKGAGKAWLDDVTLSSTAVEVVAMNPPTPAPSQPADPALRPIRPTPGWFPKAPEAWLTIHQALLAKTQKNRGPCDILLLGDSIGAGWGGTRTEPFIPEWVDAFGQYETLNFSIGGDCTQNILWRLLNGEGDGVAPRLVILAVGSNNVWDDEVPPDAVAAGVHKCVKVARRKFPSAKVLVIAPLPMQEDPRSEFRRRLDAIRSETLALLRENPDPSVRVVNFSRKFLQPDGTISAEIMPDFVHPNSAGYEIYAERLRPVVAELIGE